MMSDDPQRVLLVNDPIDNMRGVTQRVKEESTIDNTRGVTRRVYVVGGGGNIDELNVTPSTSAQTITASGGTDGYSPVNVAAVDASIDANIVAGNIKKDVSILGVTGTYEGATPTGTMYIISNGTYNVADKAIANVQVPTTAPTLYREFQLDGTGKLISNTTTTHIMDFTGMTDVDTYALAYAYYHNTAISGAVDMSDLTTVSGSSACAYMFSDCTGITSIDLSSLSTISGSSACFSIFFGCTSLATVYIGGTTAIDFGTKTNQFTSMFKDCTQNIDVYAPAGNQAQIEAFSGYPNFGGTGTVTWHWRS